ncbi:hypothetical protein MKW94_019447 [Papaver nudicaule]|uniref:FACT complex subunit SSRP1 n=1 Tax=Papaver nudicaule TaxID=74823 RepID=A0AA41VF05_PAPNU|nr:hypothetical protein [Papaver nudicaule]
MHAAAGTSMHYFDLLVSLRNDQEYLFGNIQRNEYHNLYDYINDKGLKIINHGNGPTMKDAEQFKDAVDESDDEDFKPMAETSGSEEGSATDDSGGEDSDASLDEEDKEMPAKKESRKEASTSKPPSATKRKSPKDGDKESKKEASASKPASAGKRKKSPKDGDNDGGKKKKPKKKKDPNAPKNFMSSFMFFSQAERENIKKNNPGLSFTNTAKALGEQWKKMTAEEKEPYEAKAKADKIRYKDAMAEYKRDAPAAAISHSDSE